MRGTDRFSSSSEKKKKRMLSPRKRKEQMMPFFFSAIPSVRSRRAFWPLLVLGIVLASEVATIYSLTFILLLVYLLGFYVPSSSDVGDLSLMFLGLAPPVSLLVGLPTWYLVIELPARATIHRGVVFGVVSSIIAHPLIWMSLSVLSAILNGGGIGAALSKDIQSVPLYSLFSLILVGWITIPIGGYAGHLLIRLRQKLTLPSQFQDPLPQEKISEH
jgi:hypothetical protein